MRNRLAAFLPVLALCTPYTLCNLQELAKIGGRYL